MKVGVGSTDAVRGRSCWSGDYKGVGAHAKWANSCHKVGEIQPFQIIKDHLKCCQTCQLQPAFGPQNVAIVDGCALHRGFTIKIAM